MYIFLDVDGVLNTKEDWERRAFSLRDSCVEVFCAFIKKLDHPKIVLSSTWRNGITRDGTTAAHVDMLLEALRTAGITEMDRTAASPTGSRSDEIQYYLRRHPQDTYIILDDDASLFADGSRTKGLYLVDPETGLTKQDGKALLKRIR